MSIPTPPDTGPPNPGGAAAEWIFWFMAASVVVALILVLLAVQFLRQHAQGLPLWEPRQAAPSKPAEPHLAGYTPQQRAELAEIERVVKLDRKRRRV